MSEVATTPAPVMQASPMEASMEMESPATTAPGASTASDESSTTTGSSNTETTKSPEELREEQWSKGEVPEDILKAGDHDTTTGQGDEQVVDKGHSLRLKHTREGKYQDRNGISSTRFNPNALSETQRQEAMSHGLIKGKEFDAFFEFGGTERYSTFARIEAGKPDAKLLIPDADRGIIPGEFVTTDMIGDAFDLWNAEQHLAELKQDQEDQLRMGDEGSAQDEQAQADQQKTAEDEIAKAEEMVKQAERKVREDEEELKKKQQENKVITDSEAAFLVQTVEMYSRQEDELVGKLKNATEDDEPELLKQLTQVRKSKAQAMLTGIGYSPDESERILAGPNPELSLLLQIARHTALSKEQTGPNILELNRVIKGELIQSVTDLINKGRGEEEEKATWESVSTTKSGEALRAAMKGLGIDETRQNELVQELLESANGEGRALGVRELDSIEDLLESLVTNTPREDAQELKTEERASVRKFPEKDKGFLKELQEQLGLPTAEAAATWFNNIAEHNLNFGSLIKELLTGEGYGSALGSMGYESKDRMEEHGYEMVVDANDIETWIGAGQARDEKQVELLLEGFEEASKVMPISEKVEKVRDLVKHSEKDMKPVLVSGEVKDLLEIVSNPTNFGHKAFVEGILKKMGRIEPGDHGDSKTTISKEAFEWILQIPERTRLQLGEKR